MRAGEGVPEYVLVAAKREELLGAPSVTGIRPRATPEAAEPVTGTTRSTNRARSSESNSRISRIILSTVPDRTGRFNHV
jgi:hypothetical protein